MSDRIQCSQVKVVFNEIRSIIMGKKRLVCPVHCLIQTYNVNSYNTILGLHNNIEQHY